MVIEFQFLQDERFWRLALILLKIISLIFYDTSFNLGLSDIAQN